MRRFILLFILFSSSAIFAEPKLSFHDNSLIIHHPELEQPVTIKKLSFLSDSSPHVLYRQSGLIPLTSGNFQILYASHHASALLVVKPEKDGIEFSVAYLKGQRPEKISLDFASAPDDFYSGLTEKVIDGPNPDAWKSPSDKTLNLNGERITLEMQGNLSLTAPFFISSSGYSLEILGTQPGVVDFGNSEKNTLKLIWEGEKLGVRLNFKRDPLQLIADYTLRSGPPVRLPDWAFRQWRWRDENGNRFLYSDNSLASGPYNSTLMEDLLTAKALDIPLGVYWIDRPWAIGKTGYDDFEWDDFRFPKAKEMIEWIGKQGIKLGVWIAPAFSGETLKFAEAQGFILEPKDPKGEFSGLIDFRNPRAVQYWKESGIKKLLDLGVRVFKLDRGDESFPASQKLRELKNDFPHLYAKNLHAIAKESAGDDFALLARAGFRGSSRYTAFWGGDITATEWGLRSSILGVQKAAIMGYPLWGSDTGGYSGKLDPEVLAKWIAFSTFTPIMEVGPLKDKSLMELPFDEKNLKETLAIYHFYSHLRERLLPLFIELGKNARATGTPIIRPLFAQFPDDQKTQDDWESFMFGDSILVHPLWKKGEQDVNIYLPEGTWRDIWNPEHVLQGNQEIKKSYLLHQIPVFIRAESDFSFGDLNTAYQESVRKVQHIPSLSTIEEKEEW